LALRYSEKNIIEDTKKPFNIVANSNRYWKADPFLFEKDGIIYVFYEVFDKKKQKGMIAYSKLDNNKFTDMQIIIEDDAHLSYPFIFEENGKVYIMPESYGKNGVYIWEAVDFPNKWQPSYKLLDGRYADTTFVKIDDVEYYFTLDVNNKNFENDSLCIFKKENENLVPHKGNPVVKDSSSARPAGKIFDLIRPSQVCTNGYGQGLKFNKVIEIESYKEKCLKTITVDDVNFDKKGRYVGMHTYNRLNNIDIIDVKTEHFDLLNFVFYILRKIKVHIGLIKWKRF